MSTEVWSSIHQLSQANREFRCGSVGGRKDFFVRVGKFSDRNERV